MPPKRPAPADEPPPSQSSSDEEENSYDSVGSDEVEEESVSEEQPNAAAAQKTAPPKPSFADPPPRAEATALKPDSSSSEEESDESGGEDSDVTPVAAAKPAESQGSRPPPSKKLKLVEDVAKTPPKKPNAGAEEESSKKQPFQRLWSEEDEITFLEGMIEFCKHRRIDPSANINSFYEFIKDRLQLDVIPKQLVNKMKNCKKKLNSSEARASNGKNRLSVTPNELRIHELSKILWDSEEGILREKSKLKSNKNTPKKKSTATTPIADRKTSPAVFDDSPCTNATPISLNEGSLFRLLDGRVDSSFLKTGLELMSSSKREELEKRWEELNLAELQVLSDRARLILDGTNMILDAYKKS